MGTEPTAAARCNANWPCLSLMRAEAWCEIRVRAVDRLFFDAQKWRLVWRVGELVGWDEGGMVLGMFYELTGEKYLAAEICNIEGYAVRNA